MSEHSEQTVIEQFRAARRSDDVVVLEGFHAVKHTHRFAPEAILRVVTPSVHSVLDLCRSLAPELEEYLSDALQTVSEDTFRQLAPRPPHTGVMAIAHRKHYQLSSFAKRRLRPTILLYDPRHYGNIGASIRVAAAADATGVLVYGDHSPWHPEAIRGAAGLQFAIPVLRVDAMPNSFSSVVAIDPDGELLDSSSLDEDSLFVFGSERDGLPDDVLARVNNRIRIPMAPHVSSLNLATSVAIMLYARGQR